MNKKNPGTVKAAPQIQFTPPTPEEREEFYNFMTGVFGSREEIPAEEKEAAIDKVVEYYRGYFEKTRLGNPKNLKELQELLGLLFDAFGPAIKDSDEQRKQDTGIPDFTAAPSSEKIRFARALRKTRFFKGLEKTQKNETSFNGFIATLLKFAFMYGHRPKSFDELAIALVRIDNWMERFPTDSMAMPNLLPEIDEVFPLAESGRIVEKILDRTLTALSEKEFTLNSKLIPEQGNNWQEVGAAMGSSVNEIVKELPADIKEAIESTIHEELDSKLDEIQRRLGQLCGTQEKLEQIQDQLAELMAANKKREQFEEMPPMPVVDESSPSKKQYTVDRERITCTVDPILFELFHHERKSRGVTVSRMQEVILWQRYGKPKLSFEIQLGEDPLPDSPKTIEESKGHERKKSKANRK